MSEHWALKNRESCKMHKNFSMKRTPTQTIIKGYDQQVYIWSILWNSFLYGAMAIFCVYYVQAFAPILPKGCLSWVTIFVVVHVVLIHLLRRRLRYEIQLSKFGVHFTRKFFGIQYQYNFLVWESIHINVIGNGDYGLDSGGHCPRRIEIVTKDASSREYPFGHAMDAYYLHNIITVEQERLLHKESHLKPIEIPYFDLRKKYIDAVTDLGWVLEYDLYDHINEIIEKYLLPNRYFHSVYHIREVLKSYEGHKGQEPTTVLAILYHDVIYGSLYNKGALSSEMRSARFARKHLRRIGLPENHILEIERKIVATQNHSRTLDEDTNLFLDLDQTILGAPEREYVEYAGRIWLEFKWVGFKQFIKHRKVFLRERLKAERIFHTSHFFEKFEKVARTNIANELSWKDQRDYERWVDIH